MVPQLRAWLGLGTLCVAVGLGCNALSGLNDLNKVECDGGGCDEIVPSSVQTDACTAQGAEVCTDGVDNDCNGLIDCADPACGSFACVAVPEGWSLIAFEQSVAADGGAGSPCPTAFPKSANVALDPDLGPATCKCDCAGTPPSCVDGTIKAAVGGMLCPNAQVLVSDGGCGLLPTKTAAAFRSAAAIPPSGGTCLPTATVQVPSAGRAQSCSGALGGGCPGGVCTSGVAVPFRACISHPGTVACPPSHPKAHAAGALTDTRQCSPCTCATKTACKDPILTTFSDVACKVKTVSTLDADGLCRSNPGNGTSEQSFKYTATPTFDCSGMPTTPTGTAAIASPETICCP